MNSNFIPYSTHVTDKIIKTKSGDYLKTWEIGGLNYTGMSDDTLTLEADNLIILLKSLKKPYAFNTYFHINLVKRLSSPKVSDHNNNYFVDSLNSNYLKNIEAYTVKWYFTIIFRPYNAIQKRSIARKIDKIDFIRDEEKAINNFSEISAIVSSAFSHYNYRELTAYEENGIKFSEQLELFNYILTGIDQKIPIQDSRISEYLVEETMQFGNSGFGQVEAGSKSNFFALGTIKEFSNVTRLTTFEELNTLKQEFILSCTFVPLEQREAKTFLEQTKKRLISTDDGGASQIDELDEAIDGIIAGTFQLGESTITMQTRGGSLDEVQDNFAQLRTKFSDAGMILSFEKIAPVGTLFSQIPANLKFRPRIAKLSSTNIICFSPFYKTYSGKKQGSPWGDSTCILKTSTAEPYYFNFHYGDPKKDRFKELDLGNTKIIGKSGSGKTALLGFLASQSQRLELPPKIMLFDKDLGLFPLVKALGGEYFQVKKGIPTGFNPFQLKETPENITFLSNFIKMLVVRKDEVIKADQEQQIENALQSIYRLPLEERRLKNLRVYFPNDNSGDCYYDRLRLWVEGGSNAWVFDNIDDNFSLNNIDVFGIDYTEYLDEPILREPINYYLIHRMQEMISSDEKNISKPFLWIMDEFWKPLLDQRLKEVIKNKEKTIRKEFGVTLFATQSPSDVAKSDICSDLIEQTATWIFLANPDAKYSDYKEFGLTEDEFRILKTFTDHSRKMLIKQGGKSTVCMLDLNDVPELNIISGSEERTAIAKDCISINPENWIDLYYDKLNVRRENNDH